VLSPPIARTRSVEEPPERPFPDAAPFFKVPTLQAIPKVAHVGDSGLSFQVNVLKTFRHVPSVRRFIRRRFRNCAGNPFVARCVVQIVDFIGNTSGHGLCVSFSSLLRSSLELGDAKSMSLKYEPASEPLHIPVRERVLC